MVDSWQRCKLSFRTYCEFRINRFCKIGAGVGGVPDNSQVLIKATRSMELAFIDNGKTAGREQDGREWRERVGLVHLKFMRPIKKAKCGRQVGN